MTFTQPLYSLALFGVWDAGIADKERIVMRAIDRISLGLFAVTIGIRGSAHTNLFPLRDHSYWFPDRLVQPADWIILYTGKGEERETQLNETALTAYTYHWGRPQTLFNYAEFVPLLFQIGGCLAAPNNSDKPFLIPIVKEEPRI